MREQKAIDKKLKQTDFMQELSKVKKTINNEVRQIEKQTSSIKQTLLEMTNQSISGYRVNKIKNLKMKSYFTKQFGYA